MKRPRTGSNGNGSAPSAPFREYLDGKIKSDEYFRRVKKDTDRIVRRELATPRTKAESA
jgi:hypothetical protein